MSFSPPQADGSTVPKFSSFKPKKAASKNAETVDGPDVHSASRTRGDAAERLKKRRERRETGSTHARNHQPERSGSRKGHYSQSRSRPDEERVDRLLITLDHSLGINELVDSDAFFVDRRGDSKNVEYGSLHRYSIPSFHRTGYGRVLVVRQPPKSTELKVATNISPGDEDLEFVEHSDEDDLANGLSRAAREENAALVGKTKEHPLDAEAWVGLIEHQAKIVKPGVDAAQVTNSEKRAVADIRLSISVQALCHISNGTPGHTELVLGMLEQGKQIWETSKLTAKWTGVLKDCPDNIKLWIPYLEFVQTNHLAFRYDQCRDAYNRCLTILREARLGASGSDTPKIASIQIYVLLRLTTFMRDAGYDELSYALWQALFEYHFFAPPGLTDRKDKLKMLEDFWDSDVPRIGEEGAQGWTYYLQHGERTARRVKSYTLPRLATSQPLASFADGETDLLGKLHLHAVTDNDDSAEDPYRYVMFSDLQSCLEPLIDEMPTREVLSAFLCFIHLPPMPGLDLATRAWWTDQFLTSGVGNIAANDKDVAGIINPLVTSFSLFHEAFKQRPMNDVDPESLAFVDRVLTQLLSAQPDDEDLAEYYVAYKLAFFPGEAAKAAKRLLKSQPSSFRRYNAYALVEAQLGRGERAAEVWVTALKMSQDFENAEMDYEILLRHSWASTLLHQEGGGPEALRCLLNMFGENTTSVDGLAENTTVSASQRLRMTRVCEAGFERLIYGERADLAVLYAECQIWFAYLADDEDLTSATGVRRTYSARLARHGLASVDEYLLQMQAGLFRLHIDRHRPYKPAILRQELLDNLRSFPHNSILLELYIHIGAQTRIDDRLRASLHDDPLTGPDATVVGWSFAIAQELRRCASSEIFGATTSSVRSTFSRALLAPDSKVKHSVFLWSRWLTFELPPRHPANSLSEAQERQALGRAKQVFLDGLRYLPWCKAWVIMGLRASAREGGMAGSELRQVYDVLGERELRVRMSVEEMEEAVAGLDV
ncbi:hypothetical protein LTR33_004911 [Friedmanniomyces endolithicus]|nr:hypothetical protein LTR33_004911 [Friedmanniomyces endolithicus]